MSEDASWSRLRARQVSTYASCPVRHHRIASFSIHEVTYRDHAVDGRCEPKFLRR